MTVIAPSINCEETPETSPGGGACRATGDLVASVSIRIFRMTVTAQSKLPARYSAPDVSPLNLCNETMDQLLDHLSDTAQTCRS